MLWKGMTLPGVTPPPLIRLAIHIFSIHANSASCERLFSLFGNVQTRKRNRMTSKTLQMIAEVKMHLHDSHTSSWNLKQQTRAKRQFGQPSSIRNQDASLPTTPSSIPPSMPPPPPSERNVEDESDLDIHPISFREMIEDFTSLAADEASHIGGASTSVWVKRSICDLFDFTSAYWTREYHKKNTCHLNEERNFYEFLSNHDIDAAGVEESEFCDYK